MPKKPSAASQGTSKAQALLLEGKSFLRSSGECPQLWKGSPVPSGVSDRHSRPSTQVSTLPPSRCGLHTQEPRAESCPEARGCGRTAGLPRDVFSTSWDPLLGRFSLHVHPPGLWCLGPGPLPTMNVLRQLLIRSPQEFT